MYDTPRRKRLSITNSLDTKSLSEIRKILADNNTPAKVIEEHVERIRAERAKRRGKQRKHSASVAYWRYIRTPLHKEIHSINTSLVYYNRNPTDPIDMAKREVYEAYLAVLMRLADKFSQYVALYPEHTPQQLLKQFKSEGKYLWVEDGEHWADWVPARIKSPVMQAFGDIPYRKQAKHRDLFERVVPKGHSNTRRGILEQAIRTEAETRQRQIESGAGDADKLRGKLHLLNTAMARLNRLRDNRPLPHTWHGLFTDDELETIGEARPVPAVLDVEDLRKKAGIPAKKD